jgi:hypothetical protein
MDIHDLERRVSLLEGQLRSARADERAGMRPRVRGLIRKFHAEAMPVPRTLARLERQLEDEALEDMFDNMPV